MSSSRTDDLSADNPKRLPLFLVLSLISAMACAVEVPPPGGPVDKTPPRVLGTSPVRDSAGVAPDAPITFHFSEKMTKKGIGRFLQFEPEASVSRERWGRPEAER